MDVDIWAWVGDTQRQLHDSGEGGMAFALGELPAQAQEGRYAQLDVMAPAVAMRGQELGLPWVELYARHWHLQGRLGSRMQGASALQDAIGLREFAKGVEDCPDAACSIVDLALCQANIDGPGYAEDRIALITGALDGDAGPWTEALNQELATALLDAGSPEEALQLVGVGVVGARALFDLGRNEEALIALDVALEDDRAAGIMRARVLARLGRHEEAGDALPGLDEIGETPRHWLGWSTAVSELVGKADQVVNSWQLGRVLRGWIEYFESVGAFRTRVELALVAGDLAVSRKSAWMARQLADLAEASLDGLHDRDGLLDRVAALRSAAGKVAGAPAPGPDDELAAYFDAADVGTADPEQWVAWLLPAHGVNPEVTQRLVTTMGFLGFPRSGADLLWDQVVKAPAADDASATLAGLLIEAGDDERVLQLVGMLPTAAGHMTLARLHQARERWEECAAEAAKVIEAEPASADARRLAAVAAQQLDDYTTAAGLLKELTADGGGEAEDVWRMVVFATAAKDWELVRAGAARLDLPALSTEEGPIEERWHLARVLLPAADGTTREIIAQRTGPATARLLMPQPTGSDFNAGDVVVVDPQPLEPMPESEEERQSWMVPFAAVTLLQPGGYMSWFFDGAAPDERAWEEFSQVLAERDWPMWVYSDENYTVTHPGTGERLPGIYGWVAVPPAVTPQEVDALLDDVTERWVHPLAWLDLAKAAEIEVERHERIVKEYGL
ncbi:tetratricopeptide repeat protein [Rhizohabitans arisaemae]|uniref:tetratricopeptide repeat protein n=1 Tax=Rhizohabitans arisaemae TaxID=2720610 RepID=UPI0024B1F10F|nr:tetratricopeptide repeat protein [Rhizohabitans arisaemae]